MEKINIRDANIKDISFLVETIIEAEKSGTDIFSYSTIFGLSEIEARGFVEKMLLEEIEDCELSISSFKLATYNNIIIGASAAWLEEKNGISSVILKGNLLNYFLPKINLDQAKLFSPIIKEVNIENYPKTFQIGLVYINKEYRGNGLVDVLINNHIKSLKVKNPEINQIYIQVFSNNIAAIKAYKKNGFNIIKSKKSLNQKILKLLPFNEKILMLKEINN